MTNEPGSASFGMPTLLRRVQQTYANAIRAALADAGYDDIPTNGLYLIAGLSRAAEGAAIGQFVRRLNLSKQRAGQLVDALVIRGYFSRTPDENDRRQLIVNLTERGRAAAAVLEKVRAALDEVLLAKVGKPALDTTVRTLTALIDLEPNDRPGEMSMSGAAAIFKDRSLNDAVFRNCTMARSRFENVRLADARILDVNFRGAIFCNVNMSNVSIDDANIEGMTIMGHDVKMLIEHFCDSTLREDS